MGQIVSLTCSATVAALIGAAERQPRPAAGVVDGANEGIATMQNGAMLSTPSLPAIDGFSVNYTG